MYAVLRALGREGLAEFWDNAIAGLAAVRFEVTREWAAGPSEAMLLATVTLRPGAGAEVSYDGAFDYVVLSQTLQAMHEPKTILEQLLRIGRRAVVSLPNFAHWRLRWYLFVFGRMPMSAVLPDEWYATPNIHLCSIKDFVVLCRDLGIVIERSACLDERGVRRRQAFRAVRLRMMESGAGYNERGGDRPQREPKASTHRVLPSRQSPRGWRRSGRQVMAAPAAGRHAEGLSRGSSRVLLRGGEMPASVRRHGGSRAPTLTRWESTRRRLVSAPSRGPARTPGTGCPGWQRWCSSSSRCRPRRTYSTSRPSRKGRCHW